MDNFTMNEVIELDEDGVPVEIFEDEAMVTEKSWQTTALPTETVTEKSLSQTAAANPPVSVVMLAEVQTAVPITEKTEEIENEFTQSEFAETAVVSAETQKTEAVTSVTESAEKATGTETAVSSVPQETGITAGYTEVTADTPVQSGSTNNAMGFLLLAGVFGAVIAAAVFFMKNKKKSADVDISDLSAKERDALRLNKEKKQKQKKQRKSKKRLIPRTAQKTLPYQRICDEYIFRVAENKYSKTYQFEDINYSIAKQEEQEAIFLGFCSVLNSFDTSADVQVTVYNNKANKAEFNKMVLLKHKGNDFDHYINVYNDMLVEKMEQGQNGIIRNKYLTVTVQAADLETAQAKFISIDLELTNAFKKIGSVITPLTSNDRVNLLKDIFRSVDEKIPQLTVKDFKRQADRAYCSPDYFEFKKGYFMWNDKYARTMFIKDMPASLQDHLLTDIANTNLNAMVTVNISPVDPYKALKIVNHQLTSMRANKLQAEKKAIQSGYTSDIINEDLKHSLVETEELLDDLRSKNQKMFLDNVIIMVTADDFDELESNTETIEAVIRKHICSIRAI